MPSELLINAPNYARIARQLEQYGSKELRRQMGTAMKDAAKPIVPALRRAVLSGATESKDTAKDRKAKAKARRKGLGNQNADVQAFLGMKKAPRRTGGGAKARANQALSKSRAYEAAVANEALLGSAQTKKRREALERRALSGTSRIDLGDGKPRTVSRTSLRGAIAKGIQIDQRTTGRRAGVTVRTRNSLLPADQKALPRLLNRGKWRHPVFGNREVWVEQQSPVKGWWNDTMAAHRPKVEAAVREEFGRWVDRLGTEIRASSAWERSK